ncbi:ADP-ribosylation factor 2 [Babesia ovis]|uniref:ADP-ribosylation factor-like protein 2 n=1 Tax=Babesia ovis TaxID=5869 RepID=A0A9W5TCM4_BABOV|nr:ADP-ribosylation factor 2 [Babesia ovis]
MASTDQYYSNGIQPVETAEQFEGTRLVSETADSHEVVKTQRSNWDLPALAQSLGAPGNRAQRTIAGVPDSLWIERLRILRDTRDDLCQEPSMSHLAEGLNGCIDTISRMLGTTVLRGSPKVLPVDSNLRKDIEILPCQVDSTPAATEQMDMVSPIRGARTVPVIPPNSYEEQTLPGHHSYSLDNVIDALDSMDISRDEEDIPVSLKLEAHAAEGHFDTSIVKQLYSKRWVCRMEAIEEIIALLRNDDIIASNEGVIQRAVSGVTMALNRLFQDHALKVLIKSLDLLDAFFGFMERNQCISATTARSNTSVDSQRANAVYCGSQFLDSLVSRLGDRVSAVVNCAICALLKIAESNCIPTYEDIAKSLLRSLGPYNLQPGIRSICNRLRLLSTIILRSPTYNSHGIPRLAIKPSTFFETIGALCHHSHGLVRAAATETMAVGVKAYFKDSTPHIEPSTRSAIERIDLQSVSVYEGDSVVIRKGKALEQEIRVLMLGLDNAGKTTILKRLNGEDISHVEPTLGFNIKTLEHNGYHVNVWDVGGQKTIRSFWRNYFENTDALVWVVDSADTLRLEDSRKEIETILNQDQMSQCTLLVFANKQDVPGALSVQEIQEQLGLQQVTNERSWRIHGCSGVSGEGIVEGIEWLVNDVAQRIYNLDYVKR